MNEGIIFWLVIGAISLFSVLIVLVPIVGLTARFALKPLMESIGAFRDVQGQGQAMQLLERRVALMEERMSSIDRSLRPLLEQTEFRHQLDPQPVEASADKP